LYYEAPHPWYTKAMKLFSQRNLLLFCVALLFSYILFWRTFGTNDGTIEIATKIWSDFGATVPLIRSFTYGDNFPPQYPIFAGPPIRYHFIFFMIVGWLEKSGIPLDWALNTLSTLAFTVLLFSIFYLAKEIFKSTFVGFTSVFLFLCNGSLGFIEFFKKNPLSLDIFQRIIHNDTFSSFGPYDGKIVSAFWSLNIFTNQRHLALGYALTLCSLLFLYRYYQNKKIFTYKKAVLFGIGVGVTPFIHLTGFTMIAASLVISFILFDGIRKQILIAGIIAALIGLPQIRLMGTSQIDGVKLINPGYLIAHSLTLENFFTYWIYNLGLLVIFAPIGFIAADKNARKMFLPFLAFFIVGNIFQLSPEIASNHKFFNMFVIGANIYASYALFLLWKKAIVYKILFLLLLIPFTLSGIIDLFPIVNDRQMIIDDIKKNPSAEFILKNTPPDAVFLNAQFLFDPASLAGRKIYLGWPYFAWSAGYDATKRHNLIKTLMNTNDKNFACTMLQKEGIDYIEIQNPTSLEEVRINYLFFDTNFMKIHTDPESRITIYDVNTSCSI
jgi:hypothetical protein